MPAETAAEWFYLDAARQPTGPVTLEFLQSRVRQGKLLPQDLVWRQGLAEWTEARLVEGLVAPAQAAPAAQEPFGQQAPAVDLRTGLPQARPTMVRAPGDAFNYAGFWKRFLARIIDIIICSIAGCMIGCVVGGVIGGTLGGIAGAQGQPTPHDPIQLAAGCVGNLLGLIMGWLYYALMESSSKQATVGKMALGIRVTDLDGNRISFARATGRYFATLISWLTLTIGFIIAGFTERKQALHDIIAGTLVVNE
ncbi:MAG: RDD family protein [Planctomycetota bacterium]|nr:RDD family protein [Planctomycetota bacterium]